MVLREQRAQQTLSQEVDTDESEYDDVWPTRIPASAIRLTTPPQQPFHRPYQNPQPPAPFVQRKSAVQPGQTYIPPGSYIQGNTQLNVHHGAPPPTGKKGRT